MQVERTRDLTSGCAYIERRLRLPASRAPAPTRVGATTVIGRIIIYRLDALLIAGGVSRQTTYDWINDRRVERLIDTLSPA